MRFTDPITGRRRAPRAACPLHQPCHLGLSVAPPLSHKTAAPVRFTDSITGRRRAPRAACPLHQPCHP
ncbi:hypothetical protein DUNSADRAFT_207 [Dunaliella salina]|uniref:Encoded protein n=1 Tax=Dunaliella salina TaxID=3046 RepID=A0ABQ7GYH2_DUNSA|nr:hypothetical protein DUNSADRAFT_207 [Dunaliella salina]|eukprot:KAF5839656.1 hypothetical protein DUNSADRAFT_207 [Dunaliella salina]